MDQREVLLHYLQGARDALVGKLEGLSEHDARRPMTRTGTNLLGLVKHLAAVEAGYFGATFGRPFPEPMDAWADDAEPNADMWATPEESREDVVGLYRRATAHADETIRALPLDTAGRVAWWPAGRDTTTLHAVLVHVLAETHRHAGHADVVRELVDGTVGMRRPGDNVPELDDAWWAAYREQLERAARQA